MAESKTNNTAAPKETTEQPTQPQVKWDDANMKSSYANVCNVMSTREEVVLLFGVNQTWQAAQKNFTVQLTDRIILNPFAAKRLSMLLSNLVREHEARFGQLNLDVPTATVPAQQSPIQ
jgi:uncharacterized protein DUF3467